ncbi:hypothetical protein LAZ67_1005089 [Cordylochernes scorpioides]|uniref:Uncharacterized protein n=1 Tax=Cordylochernes scorpioides TaxID=51811 RepID=A0ABY6K102_9ARAC|nr:hypothetical protein LAZ67_1005089 [Cordylochernes scorpioides]
MRNGSTSAILRAKSRVACPANFQNRRLGPIASEKGNALHMVGPDRRSIFRAPETWQNESVWGFMMAIYMLAIGPKKDPIRTVLRKGIQQESLASWCRVTSAMKVGPL